MSDKSQIGWTDASWNPVRGCSKVSEGCRNCYAMAVAASPKLSGPGRPYDGLARIGAHGPEWTNVVRFVPEKLGDPLSWRKPRRIFVNSMSDLCHEGLPFEQIAAIWGVMILAERHEFQVLTKRPERAAEFDRWIRSNPLRVGDVAGSAARLETGPAHACLVMLSALSGGDPRMFPAHVLANLGMGGLPSDAPIRSAWPPRNVLLGVSVEDQPTAESRIPHLLGISAAGRFISYEPALGPLDLTRLQVVPPVPPHGPGAWLNALSGHMIGPDDILPDRLAWVIAGGESGRGHRTMDPAWAQAVREQCRDAGVPFYMKQDSGPRAGMQGRLPDDLWACKEFPHV